MFTLWEKPVPTNLVDDCVILKKLPGSLTAATGAAQDGVCNTIKIRGSKYQDTKEGTYVLQAENSCRGKPSWVQEGRGNFLYAENESGVDYWVVGAVLCGSKASIQSEPHQSFDSPLEVPSWLEANPYTQQWTTSVLSMSCENKSAVQTTTTTIAVSTTLTPGSSTTKTARPDSTTTDNELCEKIKISGTKYQTAREGVYTLKTENGCGGKPSWEHESRSYHIYAYDYDYVDQWIVGDGHCSRFAGIKSAMRRSVESPLQVPSGDWLEYSFEDDGWVESSLSFSCGEEPEWLYYLMVIGIPSVSLILLCCCCGCICQKLCQKRQSTKGRVLAVAQPQQVYSVDMSHQGNQA